MQTAELIPVAQWVYNLYKVTYWNNDPDIAGSQQIKTASIAASSESHMNSEAWEHAPGGAEFMTWEIVKENVGHPRVIGSIHGLSIHEGGWAHGQRLAGAM